MEYCNFPLYLQCFHTNTGIRFHADSTNFLSIGFGEYLIQNLISYCVFQKEGKVRLQATAHISYNRAVGALQTLKTSINAACTFIATFIEYFDWKQPFALGQSRLLYMLCDCCVFSLGMVLGWYSKLTTNVLLYNVAKLVTVTQSVKDSPSFLLQNSWLVWIMQFGNNNAMGSE